MNLRVLLASTLLVAPAVAFAATGMPLAWGLLELRNLGAALFLVSALVFIHESGHFFFAKLFGVGVPVYSFGFGRRLFGVQVGGTDYRVSALPFGGYVRLEGADPYGHAEDDDGAEPRAPTSTSYLTKPVWQRFLIMFGGPLFNLVFPIVVFSAVYVAGEPTYISEIGVVAPDSAAEAAGLQPGDRVLAVDGVETPTWVDVDAAFEADPERVRTLRIGRDEAVLELRYTPPTGGYGAAGTGIFYARPGTRFGVDDPSSPAGLAGLRTGERIVAIDDVEVRDWNGVERSLRAATSPALTVADADGVQRTVRLAAGSWLPRSLGHAPSFARPWGLEPSGVFVAQVMPTLGEASALPGMGEEAPPSPARAAGLLEGDRIFAVDGEPVDTWGDVVAGIRAVGAEAAEGTEARPVELQVVRAGELVVLPLRPVMAETVDAGMFNRRFMIGAANLADTAAPPMVPKRYPLGAAVQRAASETVLISGLILERLGDLATRKAAVSENIGGPIAMMRQGADAAEQGIFSYARQIGFLSLSLGILNLLPVPVFDGGQLLFLLMEAVRGRPVSGPIRERALQIGVLFVVIAMVLAVFNDGLREIKRWMNPP